MKAKVKSGYTTVKVLAKHPMETGLRKDRQTGQRVPAHYIQNVSIQAGAARVLVVNNASISMNPLFKVKFSGVNKGDQVTMAWLDNKGASAKKSVQVK